MSPDGKQIVMGGRDDKGSAGAVRTFDITPDGKYLVFGRHRQNSNIVLIEQPKEP